MFLEHAEILATDAAFDRLCISDLADDKLSATVTDRNQAKEKWESDVQFPLGLFNVEEGEAKYSVAH